MAPRKTQTKEAPETVEEIVAEDASAEEVVVDDAPVAEEPVAEEAPVDDTPAAEEAPAETPAAEEVPEVDPNTVPETEEEALARIEYVRNTQIFQT